MTKPPLELLPELAEILAFSVGTSILSTIGAYLELLAVEALSTGDLTFGLWLCLLGGVAFYFGLYAMGLTELLPRLKRLLTPTGE
ncbi:MAG: hypothetical protein ACOC0Z_00915 [Halohasta sp.]